MLPGCQPCLLPLGTSLPANLFEGKWVQKHVGDHNIIPSSFAEYRTTSLWFIGTRLYSSEQVQSGGAMCCYVGQCIVQCWPNINWIFSCAFQLPSCEMVPGTTRRWFIIWDLTLSSIWNILTDKYFIQCCALAGSTIHKRIFLQHPGGAICTHCAFLTTKKRLCNFLLLGQWRVCGIQAKQMRI